MMSNKQFDVSGIGKAAKYMGLGTQLVATILLCTFFGRWLDGVFKTNAIFTAIFALIGCVLGIVSFIKTILIEDQKDKEKNDRSKK